MHASINREQPGKHAAASQLAELSSAAMSGCIHTEYHRSERDGLKCAKPDSR
jgi:hypothetical protein